MAMDPRRLQELSDDELIRLAIQASLQTARATGVPGAARQTVPVSRQHAIHPGQASSSSTPSFGQPMRNTGQTYFNGSPLANVAPFGAQAQSSLSSTLYDAEVALAAANEEVEPMEVEPHLGSARPRPATSPTADDELYARALQESEQANMRSTDELLARLLAEGDIELDTSRDAEFARQLQQADQESMTSRDSDFARRIQNDLSSSRPPSSPSPPSASAFRASALPGAHQSREQAHEFSPFDSPELLEVYYMRMQAENHPVFGGDGPSPGADGGFEPGPAGINNPADDNDYERLLQLDEQNVSVGVEEDQLDQTSAVTCLSSANIKAYKEENCVICRDGYEQGQHVRRLPCFHFFHKSCVDEWLTGHPTCPVCMKDIREMENQ